MEPISLVRSCVAALWRWRRALIAGALIAPLATAGGTQVFAVNALALCLVAYVAVRAVRVIRGRQ